jgi:hypothetical protein
MNEWTHFFHFTTVRILVKQLISYLHRFQIVLKSYDHLTTNNRSRNIVDSHDLRVAIRLIERMKRSRNVRGCIMLASDVKFPKPCPKNVEWNTEGMGAIFQLPYPASLRAFLTNPLT